MTSGWAKLDSRVVRVANISADTFELEGVDTTSTTSYPAGGGAGSAAKANATT